MAQSGLMSWFGWRVEKSISFGHDGRKLESLHFFSPSGRFWGRFFLDRLDARTGRPHWPRIPSDN